MRNFLVCLGLVVAILACANAEEKKSDTEVMVNRFVNYAKSFLTKTSSEARIFFDDEDFEGIFMLIIGVFFLLILLSIIPGILSIFAGPLLALFMTTNTAQTATTTGLTGLTGLTGIGGNIPTINVNEATGRKRRSAGMGFPSKLVDNMAQALKDL